ncbi:MAG TPA: VOC family protein [Albidovulum sp.]|uniref:VOC family protein n=1 Tax=Albidovulum sp. TaxID=1872424 RepID=UPI002C6177D9|nr:VOC family protein [Albidovulum sp.]
MWTVDHLAISCLKLAEGAEAVADALGVRLEPGGQHPTMGTHNRPLSLGPEEYLEVIAIDPDAPAPGRPRWFRLDEFRGLPRLANWVARVDDLDTALADAEPGIGRATDLARGDFRWRMAVPDDGCLPFGGAYPALIEWQGLKPQDRLPDAGCRLERLEIAHPDADRLRQAVRLADRRIVFVTGPKALRATIRTPHGARTLE